MRLANLKGRAFIMETEQSGHDVATLSEGRFGPSLSSIYRQWRDFVDWAPGPRGLPAPIGLDRRDLGPPSPDPRQVFAVGLNYRAHADETGSPIPERPVIFTKFSSCLTGPDTTVELPSGTTDWEVEVVAVVGAECRDVGEDEAWEYIAGLTVGQDLSERVLQRSGKNPQYSLAKSHPGFGPTGPWLVTPDQLPDCNDLELGSRIGDEILQFGRTGDQLFGIATLVSYLSRQLTLFPGDIIFTGTPSGVGQSRTPPRFLRPGQTLTSWVEGIGHINQEIK